MRADASRYIAFIALTVLCLSQVGCVAKPAKVDYKVVMVKANATSDTDSASTDLTEAGLNQLGADGWDLVSSYLEPETVFPNFGKEDYHTGIKSNTRSKQVVLIFKKYR